MNRCVGCGEIIPEGRQVCPNCENHIADVRKKAELKPCPFCGGKAELISIKAFEWCDYHYIARCANPNCEVDPMVKKLEKKEAIEAWNRRATDGQA